MNQTLLHNPVIYSDLPDNDVIRVGDCYYMISTSMHTMPGCPIMKSTDLAHWETVGYVFDTLEDNDAHNLLDGKGIYAKGSWAASLRFHQGTYYACFSSNDMNRFYLYRTEDIEKGPWQRHAFEGRRHDCSLLFDDDGKNYLIYGVGDIRIHELTEDATDFKPDGVQQLLFATDREGIRLRCEGCHAYKLNGYYYLLFIEWPSEGNKRRRQVCYRSKELLGEYERKIIFDDDMGFHNRGIAQGAIFDTPQHDWYAMLFQDHGAVGRIPYILPVTWQDGWPMVGINGKAPETLEIGLPKSTAVPLVVGDEFDHAENKLGVTWQWNHNPDNGRWSFTERPGYLRLYTANVADTVLHARNTLTQRTEGPACEAYTCLDASHMKPGDHAGMIALQSTFGTIGVKADETGKRIVMCVNRGDGGEEIAESVPFSGSHVYLKMTFNFKDSIDLAEFFYSPDGAKWIKCGPTLQLKYTLEHFMGCRIGLYNYTTAELGGYADFDFLRYHKGV